MSEEIVSSENVSLVEEIFGDQPEPADHSRDDSSNDVAEPLKDAPEAEDDSAEFDPFGDAPEYSFADDSAQEEAEKNIPEEKAPEKSDSAKDKQVVEKTAEEYQQEITNLNKRLHDTQKAFHESSERASNLQKKLDEIETKKSSGQKDDDNWFDDSDDEQVDSLRKELSEIKENAKAADDQRQGHG